MRPASDSCVLTHASCVMRQASHAPRPTRHASGVRRPTPHASCVRRQASCVMRQASDSCVMRHASGVRRQASGVRRQTHGSCARLMARASGVMRQASDSCVLTRASGVMRQASDSCVLTHASGVRRQASGVRRHHSAAPFSRRLLPVMTTTKRRHFPMLLPSDLRLLSCTAWGNRVVLPTLYSPTGAIIRIATGRGVQERRGLLLLNEKGRHNAGPCS